jgi:hypothetical protein
MAQTFDLAHGTTTPTVNAESTLDTETGAGVYVITVNLKNMVAGDAVELRAYKKVLTGDSTKGLVSIGSFANKQGDAADVGSKAYGEILAQSIPIVAAFGVVFTLLQTAGTARAFDWVVDQIS